MPVPLLDLRAQHAVIRDAVLGNRGGEPDPRRIVDLVFDAFDSGGAGALASWMILSGNRDALDPNKTVFEEITGGVEHMKIGSKEIHGRAYCASFNFKGSDQQKLVGKLSGGERNRVHLAKVLRSGGNVLLLVVHHIVYDGWSAGVLLRELEDALYVLKMAEGPRTRGRKPDGYKSVRSEADVQRMIRERVLHSV